MAERLAGLHPIREALAARRRTLFWLEVAATARHPAVGELTEQAIAAGIEVRHREGAAAERLPAPGLALAVGALPELGLEELVDHVAARGRRTLVALDGVEDPQNLGAMARVAEASGAGGLILTRRNAPPLSAAVSRASAGAIEWLPVARVTNLSRALGDLKERQYWILGADLAGADSLYQGELGSGGPWVVVLGAEGRGLRDGVRKQLDRAVRIPLGGKVASLNVSTAAAVILFELMRQSEGAG